jgi:hypothetical protein
MPIDLFEKPVKGNLEKLDFEDAILMTTKVDFVKEERYNSPS